MITGRVIGSTIDENGNVKVATEYTLKNGDKKVGHTRYNFLNFSRAKVEIDVKRHCETLMQRLYNLKANQELVKENISDIGYDCTSVELVVKPEIKDADGNITQAKEVITIDDK